MGTSQAVSLGTRRGIRATLLRMLLVSPLPKCACTDACVFLLQNQSSGGIVSRDGSHVFGLEGETEGNRCRKGAWNFSEMSCSCPNE
eukprot:scaffold50090_cov18-Tisochrysis_lutea.AAC.1